MPVLFFVTFVNVLGFGLIVPVLPFVIERLGGGPEQVTLIVALYSALQFLTAPIMGRLSDRFGRRPLLAWTMAGAVVSHLILAMADSVWLIVFSRAVAGAMAGNLGLTFAYVSDTTPPEQRAKSLGLLSAAVGMGFMFGPGLGGLMAGNDIATANFVRPALTAAGLSLLALISIVMFLAESLRDADRLKNFAGDIVDFAPYLRVRTLDAGLGMLGLVAFLFYGAWTMFLAIFALWADRSLSMGPTEIGFMFMYSGFIGTIVQITLIGPLSKRFSEVSLLTSGTLLLGIGLLGLAVNQTFLMCAVAVTVMTVAHAIFSPVITSTVSKLAPPAERGTVIGMFQGFGALGRVVGPALSGFGFASLGINSPFQIGAAVMLPCVLVALATRRRANNADQVSKLDAPSADN